MSKQTTEKKKAWQDSSKEFRIRNFDPALKKELQEIMKLRPKQLPFESYAVEFLIRNYRSDQQLLKQVQSRNTDLHSKIARYVDREADMKALVEMFITNTERFNKMAVTDAKKVLKQFLKSGTVKRSAGQPGRSSIKKTVPKKKGGKR